MVLIPNEKQKRVKDQRLQREFGITFAEHERRRAEQNNRCKICGREFVKSPHVDHLHFRVTVGRSAGGGWCAGAYDNHGFHMIGAFGETKKEAIAHVRKAAMPLAIRALLCSQCNRGLGHLEDPRFFHGDPDLIIKAAEYLRGNFKTKSPLYVEDSHDQI